MLKGLQEVFSKSFQKVKNITALCSCNYRPVSPSLFAFRSPGVETIPSCSGKWQLLIVSLHVPKQGIFLLPNTTFSILKNIF